jgi:two-component sensor histidine kinase
MNGKNGESRFPRLPHSAGVRYAIALVAFALSLALRDATDPWLSPDRGFILFVPAIILTTFFAGLGPAILTALLSGVALRYFFLPPFHSFSFGLDAAVGLATFALVSAVGIALVQWLRETIARLEAERARAEALAHQRAEAEERIAADLADMTRLNQLSDLLVREKGDVKECLDKILDTAIAICRADKGNIQLFDTQSGALTIAARRGFDAPFLNFFAHVRDDAAACSMAMRSAARVIVEDVMTSEIFVGEASQQVLIDAGVRAVISSPLISSTQVLLGMISTHFATRHAPHERELRFMDLLTRQAADYLERRRAHEIEKSLIREVQHRSNNLLAVVQAIASRSLSGDHSLAQAGKAFEARLQALARSNRQLTKSDWTGVDLHEIVRAELQVFADRTAVNGTNVMVSPQSAQSLSLGLHELVTNAAKYGALSNGSGKVEISWVPGAKGNARILDFRWAERGGPPAVPPARHGFGTSLLKTLFADVHFDYGVDGLNCTFTLSLGRPRPGTSDPLASVTSDN